MHVRGADWIVKLFFRKDSRRVLGGTKWVWKIPPVGNVGGKERRIVDDR